MSTTVARMALFIYILTGIIMCQSAPVFYNHLMVPVVVDWESWVVLWSTEHINLSWLRVRLRTCRWEEVFTITTCLSLNYSSILFALDFYSFYSAKTPIKENMEECMFAFEIRKYNTYWILTFVWSFEVFHNLIYIMISVSTTRNAQDWSTHIQYGEK